MAEEEGQPPNSKKPKLTDKSAPVYRIYPPPSGKASAFAVGDVVYFRPKSAKEDGKQGTVVEKLPSSNGHKPWIQFPGREPKQVSAKRLVPVFTDHPLSIIFTKETIPYRQLACSQINDQDDVLEIGCSTGEASVGLCRYGRSWVGFDTASGMIEQCSSRLESALENKDPKLWHACTMNALSDPAGAWKVANKFSGSKGPSAIFLDIGGNRDENGVIEMMSWVLQSFSGLRIVVVKSREVVKDLEQSANKQELTIDDANGIVSDGSAWLERKVKEATSGKAFRHPLQAPLVYSPVDPSNPICRYHNYDPEGCKKGQECPYDHDHCHLCLVKGHRAISCGKG
jgi:SAM-dependent methyltransferase